VANVAVIASFVVQVAVLLHIRSTCGVSVQIADPNDGSDSV